MTQRAWPTHAAKAIGATVLMAVLAACGGGDDSYTASANAAPATATERPMAISTGGTVPTTQGTLLGNVGTSMYSFLGVPYAAPPVGALRWQPPAPAAAWTGTRNATTFAPNCAQPATPFGVASVSEDCLYLNVYAPKTRGTYPVLVWIHGGAFAYGQSNDYDPSALVAQGLIVVTVNYRLGALGFLSHPALSAEQGGKSGNYGLMDQQAALRWVKNNIANFGGNPSNVTIAGESAGGFSVHAHLAAAGSRGLFQKAIAMSGAYPFAVPQDTLAQAEAKGTTVATTAAALISQAVGTTVPPCTTAACLRGLPVNVLFAGAQAAYPQGPIPPVDGAVLTEDVRTTISAGRHAKVPVIEGTTRDEWRLFAALDEYTAALSATPPKPFEAVLKTNADYVAKVTTLLGGPANPDAATAAQLFTSLYYPASLYPSITEAYSALGTDLVFACNGRIAALELQQHAPVYAYEFRDRTAPAYLPKRADFNLGASHTSELQYLFNVTNAPGTVPTTLNSSQKSLASTMVKYWANFAKTGNPNALGLRNWSRFTATSDTYQGLDIGLGGVGALSINFKTSHNCSAWNGFKDYTPTP